MCGIAGILRVWPGPIGNTPPHFESIPEAWLDILDDAVKHRGPDGRGRFRDRAVRPGGAIIDVALVHRRLSIIDHAGGFQPMVIGTPASRCPGGSPSPDNGGGATGSGATASSSLGAIATPHAVSPGQGACGDASTAAAAAAFPLLSREGSPYEPCRAHACPRCATAGGGLACRAVVFNGCIYNHRELRRELQSLGHELFTDHSDTEVLLHAWREWGDLFASRLDGMFAFAAWDAARGDLLLARDRFGEKPLHFSHMGDCVSFASTVAALERLHRFGRAEPFSFPPTAGLDAWVRFGFDATPPGGWLRSVVPGAAIVAPGPPHDWRVHAWSSKVPTWPLPERTEDLSTEAVDQLLARAVASRLEADVPIGCFLSGGVDSSLIAVHARRAAGAVRTFTVRMPSPEYDESGFAEQAARVIGSEHHTLDCDARPAEDLLALIPQLGLPFGDSSLLPSHWVSRAAASSVKVALSGDGGDEMFAGYERYRAVGALVWARSWPIVPTFLLRRSDPKSRSSKLARLLDADLRIGYPDLLSIFPTRDLRRLLTRREISLRADHAILRAEWAIAWDVLRYLPEDLMLKSDTASMATALEVRAPFLARDLSLAALATRLDVLMPGGQRKGLLRAVARRHLPAEIVDRPKMGFAVPVGEWFRSDFGGMRALLRDHLECPEPFGPDSLGINELINMRSVRRMLQEHDDAGAKSLWPWKGRDHSQRLYMLLVLSVWARWLAGLSKG